MSGFFRSAGPVGLDEAVFGCRGIRAAAVDRPPPPRGTDPKRATIAAVQSAPEQAPEHDPYGAYEVTLPRTLSLDEIAALSRHSGIHPDVLGPCRRTAIKLGWILMFRAIKPAAMEYVGQYGMLPKPPAVKVKCHERLGVVAYSGEDKEAQYQNDTMSGKIEASFALRQGLRLDLDGSAAAMLSIRTGPDIALLVDRQGRAFYSDMDMFQVLDAEKGAPVPLGSGAADDQAGPLRARLDAHLNILAALGVETALIQHGPERQWVDHKPKDERVVAFGPDGAVWSFETYESVVLFEQHLLSRGYRRGHVLRDFRANYRGG